MSPEQHRSRPVEGAAPEEKGPATDLHAGYATGLDQSIAHSATDWWSLGAARAIRKLAETGRGFDVDDIVDLVGQPTDPHYPGSAFAAAQRSGLIEPVGCRLARNGRMVRIWYGRRWASS